MKRNLLVYAPVLVIFIFATCQIKEVDLGRGAETPVTIVVLGSSTAAGTGPSDIDNAWVNRYLIYVEDMNPQHRVINLPSNDAAYGYSVAEQLANYDSILTTTKNRNIPLWITTIQPRNLSTDKRNNLMAMRDSTIARFGDKAIDFWTDLAGADGTIELHFDCGDGVHLNDAGHGVLFERIVGAGVLESLRSKGKETAAAYEWDKNRCGTNNSCSGYNNRLVVSLLHRSG